MTRLVWLMTTIVVAATACAGAASPAAPTAGPAASPAEGFHATDPSTVELAAGRPQLVEFYAEW